MGWFSKKSEELSEFPKSVNVPAPPNSNNELPPLPKLPDLPRIQMNKEEIIKTTINPKEPLPKFGEFKRERLTQEIEPFNSEEFQVSKQISPPTFERRDSEPIFVKIDRFQDASENFDNIRKKVEEIELTLREISNIKEREAQELKAWDHEIQMIKARMESIDNSLFKRLGE